jgi:c-di-GMP-binding flagellar brake protein YcgR
VRVPIRAQVTGTSDTSTFRGVTWNLSESGLQVELPELKRKAIVHLTFRLPFSETIIDVRGAVVWHSERRHGIKFKEMGEQSHESIRHFIEERSRGQH